MPGRDDADVDADADADAELFVNGTLMRGLALHDNLRGADFLGVARTAPRYRIFAIGDDLHPGMFEVPTGGISVPGELYLVPAAVLEAVEAGEPPDLYRGPVLLEDGRHVDGILYPEELARRRGADITAFGGWREYAAQRAGSHQPSPRLPTD